MERSFPLVHTRDNTLGVPLATYVVYDDNVSPEESRDNLPFPMGSMASTTMHADFNSSLNELSRTNHLPRGTSPLPLNVNNLVYGKVHSVSVTPQLHLVNGTPVPALNYINNPGMLTQLAQPDVVQSPPGGVHIQDSVFAQYPVLPMATVASQASELSPQYRMYGDIPQPVNNTLYLPSNIQAQSVQVAPRVVNRRMGVYPKSANFGDLHTHHGNGIIVVDHENSNASPSDHNHNNTNIVRHKRDSVRLSELERERADLDKLRAQLMLREKALLEKEAQLNDTHRQRYSPVSDFIDDAEISSLNRQQSQPEFHHRPTSVATKNVQPNIAPLSNHKKTHCIQNSAPFLQFPDNTDENFVINPKLVARTYQRKPKRACTKSTKGEIVENIVTSIKNNTITCPKTFSNGDSSVTITPISEKRQHNNNVLSDNPNPLPNSIKTENLLHTDYSINSPDGHCSDLVAEDRRSGAPNQFYQRKMRESNQYPDNSSPSLSYVLSRTPEFSRQNRNLDDSPSNYVVGLDSEVSQIIHDKGPSELSPVASFVVPSPEHSPQPSVQSKYPSGEYLDNALPSRDVFLKQHLLPAPSNIAGQLQSSLSPDKGINLLHTRSHSDILSSNSTAPEFPHQEASFSAMNSRRFFPSTLLVQQPGENLKIMSVDEFSFLRNGSHCNQVTMIPNPAPTDNKIEDIQAYSLPKNTVGPQNRMASPDGSVLLNSNTEASDICPDNKISSNDIKSSLYANNRSSLNTSSERESENVCYIKTNVTKRPARDQGLECNDEVRFLSSNTSESFMPARKKRNVNDSRTSSANNIDPLNISGASNASSLVNQLLANNISAEQLTSCLFQTENVVMDGIQDFSRPSSAASFQNNTQYESDTGSAEACIVVPDENSDGHNYCDSDVENTSPNPIHLPSPNKTVLSSGKLNSKPDSASTNHESKVSYSTSQFTHTASEEPNSFSKKESPIKGFNHFLERSSSGVNALSDDEFVDGRPQNSIKLNGEPLPDDPVNCDDALFGNSEDIASITQDSIKMRPTVKKGGRKKGRGRKSAHKQKLYPVDGIVDVKSFNPFKCGTCCDGNIFPDIREFMNHVYSEHNGMARAEGESQEFSLSEMRSAQRSVLHSGFKLICDRCSSKFASQLGFEGHRKWCGKSQVDRTIICPKCGWPGTIFTMKAHMKTCSDAVNNDRQPSRSLRTRASTTIKESDDAVATESETEDTSVNVDNKKSSAVSRNFLLKLCKPVKFEGVSIDQLKLWSHLEEIGETLHCSFEQCDETKLTLAEIKEHTSDCQHLPSSFLCTLCEMPTPLTTQDAVTHLIIDHPDDAKLCALSSKSDRKSKGYPKRLQDDKCAAYDTALEYRSKNHSLHLFENWIVNINEWCAIEDLTPYLQSTNSPCFVIKDDDEWESLSLFEGISKANGSYFFCGGCISASAWCPMSTSEDDCDQHEQFLAVAVSASPGDVVISCPEIGKGTIQFWKWSVMDNYCGLETPTPVFSFVVAHNFGHITCLQWCPSGIYGTSDGTHTRLGALAAASSSGHILIWVIPEPRQLSHVPLPPLFQKNPDIELRQVELDDDDILSVPLKIHWLPSKGHSLIAASMSDGSVLIWNLETFEASVDGINERVLYPCNNIKCHTGASTAVSWCPNTDGLHLTTGGDDHINSLWDLEGFSRPCRLSSTRKDLVTNTQWPLNSAVTAVAFEDSLNDSSTAALRECGFFGYALAYFKSKTPTWSLAYSDLLGAFIQGTDAGDCIVTVPKDLYKVSFDKSFRHLKVNYSVSLKATPQTSKDKELSKVGYGLVFQDAPDISDQGHKKACDPLSLREPKSDDKGTEKRHPASILSLAAATSVSFNTNVGCHRWVFCGYRSGMARVMRLPPSKC